MSSKAAIIGVDFDNTLVDYDELIMEVAVERLLVEAGARRGKRSIRDAIRNLPNGEIEWQKVQGVVYGPRMLDAKPARGVEDFLSACLRHGIKLHIVSHKTELAIYDETGTSLPDMAGKWIGRNLLTSDNENVRENVGLVCDSYFEPTRQQKLQRIQELGCTHFIDDLEETFLEESFPAGVTKILYSPEPDRSAPPGVCFAGDWPKIRHFFFDAIN